MIPSFLPFFLSSFSQVTAVRAAVGNRMWNKRLRGSAIQNIDIPAWDMSEVQFT